MKKNRILAAVAASAALVGLSACGHASTPSASLKPDPFPRETQCQDIQRPNDPHGLIGSHWFTDDACNIFNMNHPGEGVDADQAAAIVYDARMKLMMGKRDIAQLVVFLANDQLDHPTGVNTDFAGLIARRYSTITKEVNDARDALGGHAPEGYRIFFLKGEGR
ncbi:hypothetical protein [Mycobacteroides abscessus]|uniref:hypothetical protein n=1 Tax=Mycobacteroides abscessus TaxID=36809 RepID=UPI0009A6ED75|nr:hypothetical protein [Mycobacteroides abscessus]SLI42487.1 putative lipoprotein [Mycobacteroides abscessus subsp. abscessus]